MNAPYLPSHSDTPILFRHEADGSGSDFLAEPSRKFFVFSFLCVTGYEPKDIYVISGRRTCFHEICTAPRPGSFIIPIVLSLAISGRLHNTV